jgi:hypothetical protein
MSSMMQDPSGGAPVGPDPAAAQMAQQGNYPTQNDPAMKPLSDAAAAIQAFIEAEPDPQLKSMGAKLLAQCHAILAGGEKQHDAALGLSPALKFVQRQKALQSADGAPA